MKTQIHRLTCSVLIGGLGMFTGWGQELTTPPSKPEVITAPARPDVSCSSELLGEIRKLRSDLSEARFERKGDTMALLDQALKQIRADSARLRNEELLANQQVARLDAQLTSAQTAPVDRPMLEEVRAALTNGIATIRAGQSAELQRREVETEDRLRRMQREIQDIQTKRSETP